MKTLPNFNEYKLFSAFGIFVFGLEFLAIILTLIGFFYWPILAVYILCGFAFLICIGSTKLQNNTKVQKYKKHEDKKKGTAKNSSYLQLFAVFLISILFIIFLSFSTEPTVFSGRDQGSFSEAAARLSENHKPEFETTGSKEFFKIYGAGTALNFPGFNYTTEGKLITHFSIGYIAWLAVFYGFFGLKGFAIANGVLLFLFLLSFFLLTKLYFNARSAFLAFALAISSFVFSWFFKFTLSENLALALVWFGILEFSLFLKYHNQLFFFSALGTFLILTFTRIETWTLLAMMGIILFFLQKNKKIFLEKISRQKLLWILGIFFATFLVSLKVNSQFYLSSVKGLLKSFSLAGNNLDSISAIPYLLKIFYYYNILPFLLIGTLGAFYFLKKKRYDVLIPLFITLPIFVYFVHPGISLDHPWMLRRFSFAIIPIAILYTALLVNEIFRKNFHFLLVAFMLIINNLFFSAPYWNFSENKNLLSQTKTLSDNFGNNDLILIDRMTSGDGWSMITGPMNFLYGKQAVYFFNPADLDKIDTKKFDNIYLIIPDQSLGLYEKFDLEKKIIPQKNYTLQRSYLDTTNIKETTGFFPALPLKSESVTQGKIYHLNLE